MVENVRFYALLILSMFLGACASLPTFISSQIASKCELVLDDSLLILAGATDEKMLDCVSRHLGPKVKKLSVNSSGGDARTALEIGDIIANSRLHIIIEDKCHSSCANYFLPVARRVSLAPNASVILHGSIDEGLLARDSDIGDKLSQERRRELVEIQNEFAKKHSVHLGWLLYRTAREYEERRPSRYVQGRVSRVASDGAPVRGVIVEEAFMRGCLSNVRVDTFERTLVQTMYSNENTRAKYEKQGFFLTGSMQCTPTASSSQ